ncbi:MAG TPA: carboxypeptidase-like regulatory domain-containing protein, partial [Flavisolibacter sp.]|nr:carboxypeptidase-like regulatory domain-containing protein [Flavisolibacter sp.]
MRKRTILRVPLLLLCALFTTITFAQERRITGTITDERQTPLMGATITVKGTGVATTTDDSGRYSISVPQTGRTLV